MCPFSGIFGAGNHGSKLALWQNLSASLGSSQSPGFPQWKEQVCGERLEPGQGREAEGALGALRLPPRLLCEPWSSCLPENSRLGFGCLPEALSSPHMPFPIHPRIGRTNSSSREKKSGGRGGPVGLSLGFLPTMVWAAHCLFLGRDASPDTPTPQLAVR